MVHIMKREGSAACILPLLTALLLQVLIVDICKAQDCSAKCAITCPKGNEPCCLSAERALAEVDDCGCSKRCSKCHVPEGFPCDPNIDVCQTGTKCVLNPGSNDATLGIGPIHQCMNKMDAIMTKAPQKLESLTKELHEELGDDAPMYQTIGKIAKMFMEQISQAKDADFNDKPMEEAKQCMEMMDEPTLIDNSLNILRGAVEKDFAPTGFVDRTMGVVDALEQFVQKSEHKFDLKNLEPVLKAATKVQPDIEAMAGKIAEAEAEKEDHGDHKDWDYEDWDHKDWDEDAEPEKDWDWDDEDWDKNHGDKHEDGHHDMEGKPEMGEYYDKDHDKHDDMHESDTMKPDPNERYEARGVDEGNEIEGKSMETAAMGHEEASKNLHGHEHNGSPGSFRICLSVIALLIIGLML